MSKEKPGKKKVVVTTDKKGPAKKGVTPTSSRRSTREVETQQVELEFSTPNYILIAGGLGLVFLGLVLICLLPMYGKMILFTVPGVLWSLPSLSF